MASDMKSDSRLGIARKRPYWLFLFSVAVRSLHLLGAAVYLGFFLLGGTGRPPAWCIGLACVTGVVLMVTEGLRHVQFYREYAGISTFVKLILLGLAFHGLLPDAPTVTAAFIVAAFGAHLPKEIRHRLMY